MSDGPAPTPAAPATIRRRRVYYLAGFDTRSARFYHRFYRDEAARQQAVNGCRYEVGDSLPSGPDATRWPVRQRGAPGGDVDTDYVFLAWNDVVHAHWGRSTWRLAAAVPGVYAALSADGVLAATRRLSRGFYWMMLLPLLYTLAAVGLAVIAAALVAWLAAAAGMPPVARTAAAVAGGVGGLAAGLWLAEFQRVYWLLRAWIFHQAWAGGRVPALDAHWAAFARRIEDDRLADPVDETLIAGHSAGSMAAVAVAERWLALQPDGAADPSVKVLTIGSATPLLSLMPGARAFRAQLELLGRSAVPWLDYTAPADPLCYVLVDPFSACGLRVPARAGYRAASARFDRMFDPSTYRRVRGDFFRIHFQYLLATDHPVPNDWFTLTAGPRPLQIALPEGAR